MKLTLTVIFIALFFVSSAHGQNARTGRFNASDFVIDSRKVRVESNGDGGWIKPMNVHNFPALMGEGISYTLFSIKPCGINLPHHHPRATELIYIIGGSNLTTGFVEENGGRVVINKGLRSGQSTFFPQGLIHYQQNMGCRTVHFLSALNSEDPGVVTSANQFFRFPDEALAASLNVSDSSVPSARMSIPRGPANGLRNEECARRCNLEL